MPDAVREQAERELAPPRAHGRADGRVVDDPHVPRLAARRAVGQDAPRSGSTRRTRARCSTPTTRASTDVKDRIVEYLAVRKLREERGIEEDKRSGAILTLIGPPGTGKTSIGESIARALNREFVRMSLGGVRDEAEIRGHRRTYIGALPGRLVRALRDAGTMNPVILLDEVDKVGADWRGDPSAALLEVLDPAQNHSFRDHYLDVELDLSQVVFIATANVADTIPGPLLDRMEVIRFDGYTVDEKVAIARGYLWPRQRDRNGLREDEVSIDGRAARAVVTEYTREAGVRQLERELGKLLRKTATKIVAGRGRGAGRGRPRRSCATRSAGSASTRRRPSGRRCPASRPGLAVTGTGGDVLFVEATRMKGNDGLVLTGQLGDVMKESARIALSYVRVARRRARDRRGRVRRPPFHVHVPAGAIPKDGPSAGITMTTALASLLIGPPGQAHRRHDRRGHAAGPRAADRRPEAEGARRARGRADRRDHPRAEPRRPRRRPGGRARGR